MKTIAKKIIISFILILSLFFGLLNASTFVSANGDPEEFTLTLLGEDTIYYVKGTDYQELGATAYDPVDGDLTNEIVINSSSVNTNVVGNYSVTYSVTNTNSETLNKTRTIIVTNFINENNYTYIDYSGGNSYNYWNSIIKTSDGGYLVIGNQYYSYYYSYYTQYSYSNIVVRKYNQDMSVAWTYMRQNSGSYNTDYGYDAIETEDGNFICLGVYSSTTYVFLLSNTGSLLKSTSRSGVYQSIEKVSENEYVLLGTTYQSDYCVLTYSDDSLSIGKQPTDFNHDLRNGKVFDNTLYYSYNNVIYKFDLENKLVIDSIEGYSLVFCNDSYIFALKDNKIYKYNLDFELIISNDISFAISFVYESNGYLYCQNGDTIYVLDSNNLELLFTITRQVSLNYCSKLFVDGFSIFNIGRYYNSNYYASIYKMDISSIILGTSDETIDLHEIVNYSEDINVIGNVNIWYIQNIDSSSINLNRAGNYNVYYTIKTIDTSGIKTIVAKKKYIVNHTINVINDETYEGSKTIEFEGIDCQIDGESVSSGDVITAPGKHIIDITGENGYSDRITFYINPVISGFTNKMVTKDNVTIISSTTHIKLDGNLYSSGTEITTKGVHTVEVYDKNFKIVNDKDYPYSLSNDGVLSSTNQNSSSTSYYYLYCYEDMNFTLQYLFTYAYRSGYSYLQIYKNNDCLLTTYNTSTYTNLNVSLEAGDYLKIATYNYSSNSDYRGYSYIKGLPTNSYYKSYTFTIEPTIEGVEDGGVYTTTLNPNINAENMTLNGDDYNNEEIANCGNYTLVINGTNDYTQSLSFVIETILTGVENGSKYDGEVTPSFTKGTALLDGEAYTSGTKITSPGNHTLVISGENGYSVSCTFTVNLIISNVESGAVYDGSVSPTFSGGTLTLNDSEYTSGTTIDVPGNYTLTVNGANGFSKTLYFIVRPEELNVENNKTYNHSVIPCKSKGILTLDGNPYVSGTIVKSSGDHTLRIIGENGYYLNINFTLSAGANIEDEASYIDSITLQFVGDGTLDGSPIDPGHVVNTIGNHTLVVEDEATYTYHFKVEANYSAFEDDIYGSVSLTYANATSVTLDGNAYTSGTSINTIGDHQLVINGVNGYTKSIDFTINPMLSVEDGQSYVDSVVLSIGGIYDSAFIDEDEYSGETIVDSIGKHEVRVNGDLVATFYVVPTVTCVTNAGYYFDSLTPTISGGTLKLNGEDYTSGTVIDEVGVYELVINGTNSYTSSIKFILLPEEFAIRPNGYYFAKVQIESALAIMKIDGNSYVSGTIYNEYGSHTLSFEYNETISEFDFYVIPNIEGIEENGVYEESIIANTEWNNVKIDNVAYTPGSSYNIIGNHTLTLVDLDGYDFSIDFTITEVFSGVENEGVYSTTVSASVANGTLTLNGNAYTSGNSISNVGNYSLTITGTNGYENTITFTIEEVLTGIENEGFYNSYVRVYASNCTLKLDDNAYSSGSQIASVGYHTVKVIGVGDYEKEYSFTIEPVITIYVNGEGSLNFVEGASYKTYYTNTNGYLYISVGNYQSITLNGEAYTSNTNIRNIGNYEAIIYGTNGYEKIIHFTKEPCISGVVDTQEYSSAKLNVTCNYAQSLSLNDEEYTSGADITSDGNYTFVITGVGDYEKTITFSKKYTINGIVNDGEYEGYVTITNPYLSWKIDDVDYTSGSVYRVIGNHTASYTGVGGYEGSFDFTIYPYYTGVVIGGSYESTTGVRILIKDKYSNNDLDDLYYASAKLDGVDYINGTRFYNIGYHKLVIAGSNDYSYEISFKINPKLSNLIDNYIGEAFTPIIETGDSEYTIDLNQWNKVEDNYVSTNKNSNSLSEMKITATVECDIDFSYNVSSEETNDVFSIYLNGVLVDSISGVGGDDKIYHITLNPGEYISFKYQKDGSVSIGDDCALIKNLIVTPKTSVLDQSGFSIKLDDVTYVIGTEINEVGNHVLTINGVNNLVNSYNITIIPTINGVSNNGVYQGTVTPIINHATLLLDGEDYDSGTEVAEVGNHSLTIKGVNGYEYSIVFTVTPVIAEISNDNSYVGGVTPIIDNSILKLDGIDYTSGTEIVEVGNHTLSISGVNDYVYGEIEFIVLPSNVEDYKDKFFVQSVAVNSINNATLMLDGEPYDKTLIESIGNHTLKIIGKNGYEDSFDFVITENPVIRTKLGNGVLVDDFECNENIQIVIPYATLKIDGDSYTSGDDYNVVGYHTLIITGTNGYESQYEFLITENVNGLVDEGEYENFKIICDGVDKLSLNGEIIDNNTLISNVGNYTLKISGVNGYSNTYNFSIKLSIKHLEDGGEYEGSVTPVINCDNLLLNGEPYLSGTAINQIGNNSISIVGVGGFEEEITFAIYPIINGLVDNGEYFGSITVSITGDLNSLKLNNVDIDKSFTSKEIGKNLLTITGANNYIKTIEYTIHPVITGIEDGQNYDGDINYTIDGNFVRALLNNTNISKTGSIGTIGNNVLVIEGLNGYSKTYQFVIDVLFINQPTEAVINEFTPLFNSEGEFKLNGEAYTLGTKVTTAGVNQITAYGANGYIKVFEFTINPELGIKEGDTFIDEMRLKVPENTYLDGSKVSLDDEGYIVCKEIGNHQLTIFGASGYTKEINFIIDYHGIEDNYVGEVSFDIIASKLEIDNETYTRNTKYYKAGNHVLTIKGKNGYTKAYNFTLVAIVSGINDSRLYVKNAVFSTKNGTIIIDNKSYGSSVSFNEIGNHTLNVSGTDGYIYTYEFCIEEVLSTPILENSTFEISYQVKLDSQKATIKLDNVEIENGTIIRTYGFHTIEVIGTCNYSKKYEFTILPDKSLYPVSVVYGSYKLNIPNAKELKIDGKIIANNYSVTEIGKHYLIIVGANGYESSEIEFIVKETEIGIENNKEYYSPIRLTNLLNCREVLLDNKQLNDEEKDSSIISGAGEHEVILRGTNGYTSIYHFVIVGYSETQTTSYESIATYSYNANSSYVLNGNNVEGTISLSSITAIGNNILTQINTDGSTKTYKITNESGYKKYNGQSYSWKCTLEEIDAVVKVDGKEITFENGFYTIIKAGDHKIEVLGANDYYEQYTITIKNTSLKYSILSGSILIVSALGVVFFIVRRKRVI